MSLLLQPSFELVAAERIDLACGLLATLIIASRTARPRTLTHDLRSTLIDQREFRIFFVADTSSFCSPSYRSRAPTRRV